MRFEEWTADGLYFAALTGVGVLMYWKIGVSQVEEIILEKSGEERDGRLASPWTTSREFHSKEFLPSWIADIREVVQKLRTILNDIDVHYGGLCCFFLNEAVMETVARAVQDPVWGRYREVELAWRGAISFCAAEYRALERRKIWEMVERGEIPNTYDLIGRWRSAKIIIDVLTAVQLGFGFSVLFSYNWMAALRRDVPGL